MATDFNIPSGFTTGLSFELGQAAAPATTTSTASPVGYALGQVGVILQAQETDTAAKVPQVVSVALSTETDTARPFNAVVGVFAVVSQAVSTEAAAAVSSRFSNVHTLDIQQDILASAYKYRMFVTQNINQDYAFSLDIIQDIIGEVFAYELPITQSITEVYTKSLPLTQNLVEILDETGAVNNDPYDNNFPYGGYVGIVFTPSEASGSWSVVADIGGVDVSGVLVRGLTVNKEESQAQTLSFSIYDTNLSDAVVNTWNQKTVEITYRHEQADGSLIAAYPLFKGSIAGYSYEASDEIFSFTATDDLQATVQEMYRAGALLPPDGFTFKTLEQPEGANGWLWLQEAMETIPLSYGLNEDGVFTYYGWYNPNANGLLFSESNIIDQSLDVTLQDYKSIVNYVEITLLEKSQSLAEAGSDRFFQNNNHTHKVIVYSQESLDSYGLKREKVDVTETADYANSLEGWTKKQGDDYLSGKGIAALIVGATSGEFVFRGVCPTEEYPGQTDPYKLKVEEFYETIESSLKKVTYQPVLAPTTFSDTDFNVVIVVGDGVEVIEGTGGTIYVKDVDEIALCKNHAEVEVTKSDLIAAAKKRIQETHRQNLVSFDTLIVPAMTWGSGVSVATTGVRVTGRVSSVTHQLSFDSGEAKTTIVAKVPHGGKFVTAYQSDSFGVNLPAEAVQCTTDGGFDKVVYAESYKMTFEDDTVTLPTNNLDIGKY